jgi:hypothetical protein
MCIWTWLQINLGRLPKQAVRYWQERSHTKIVVWGTRSIPYAKLLQRSLEVKYDRARPSWIRVSRFSKLSAWTELVDIPYEEGLLSAKDVRSL